MGRLIRGFLYFLGAVIIGLTLWKLFGGDIPGLFQRVGDFLWLVVDSASNVLTEMWHNIV